MGGLDNSEEMRKRIRAAKRTRVLKDSRTISARTLEADFTQEQITSMVGILIRSLSGTFPRRNRTKMGLSEKLTRELSALYPTANDVTPKHTGDLLTALRKHTSYNPVLKNSVEFGEIYVLDENFSPRKRLIKRADLEIAGPGIPENAIRFAALGNTEIGNKYQRLEALHTFYHLLEREGVRTVFHLGDIIAGPPKKKNAREIMFEDLDTQIEYLLMHYPEIDGIKTYFITSSDKEGAFRDKREAGIEIESEAKLSGRKDLRYIGHSASYVTLETPVDNLELRLVHLSGKVPYARSYPVQKLIQSLQSGKKPDILLTGHLMQLEHINSRDIMAFQVGGFKDQSPSMQSDRQQSEVGGQIYTVWPARPGEIVSQNQRYVARVKTVPFFEHDWYVERNLMRQ